MHATDCFTMCETDNTICTGSHGATSGMAASMSEDQFAQLLGAIKYVAEGDEIATQRGASCAGERS